VFFAHASVKNTQKLSTSVISVVDNMAQSEAVSDDDTVSILDCVDEKSFRIRI
jgi:hypothetical protein